MSRDVFHEWLVSVAIAVLAALLALGPAQAQTQTDSQSPPPAEVEQLIKLLTNPAVKSWLETQAQPAAQPEPALNLIDSSSLSTALNYLQQHLDRVVSTVPRMPAQFDRAWNILLVEFEEQGVFGVLGLVAAFLAAGMGLDFVTRKLMTPYRAWMKQHRHDTPQGRVKNFGNEQFGMVAALRDLQSFDIDEDMADKMTGYAAEYISEMSNE